MKKDIKDVELFLFDLDGTVYIGDKEIDGDLIGILVACGCVPFTVQSEYAPELKSVGIWVPDGTCFEYE